MSLFAIAACDQNRGIGFQNKLPWRLPKDLKFFKAKTMGHPIIMGRKTFESMGRVLPGRPNLVLSLEKRDLPRGASQVSLEQVLGQFVTPSDGEGQLGFVIGGAQIYQTLMPYVQTVFLTRVEAVYPADVFFPEFEHKFFCASSIPDEDQGISLNFQVWNRKKEKL
jgi:dihydrofolate reductase